MSNTNISIGGTGFAGTLTIVFIILKLLEHITWTWFWVLSPLWISFIIVLVILIIIRIVFLIIWLIKCKRK